jgi:hypothetical protein
MTLPPQSADDWLEAIHKEFAPESDRGAALVAGAMLDEALKSLLSKRLVPPERKDRDTLARDAPLSTFSARINAASQMGLISRYLARDLHLIRSIRNEFAHHPFECTFQSAKVKNWVKLLEEGSDYNRRYPKTRQDIGPPGTRWDFLGIAAWILYSLHRHLEDTQPLLPCGLEFGYIDWDQLPEDIRLLIPD